SFRIRFVFMLYIDLICIVFCFFFQAEDGIRDATVTGVQTCALPIFPAYEYVKRGSGSLAALGRGPAGLFRLSLRNILSLLHLRRSEERRVGKECRSRGAPVHETQYR